LSTFSTILLAGGKGSRFGDEELPKQFLLLNGAPVALHSFSLITSHPNCVEAVVVCDEKWRSFFVCPFPLQFAKPGISRQDSVLNGLQALMPLSHTVLIHDLARPLLTRSSLDLVLEKGWECGNCCLAKPVQNTIKTASKGIVAKTLDRSCLYEVETPQVVAFDLLLQGFALAKKNNLIVTDDCSLAELAGVPSHLVLHKDSNSKITYREDLFTASAILTSRNI